MQPAQNNTLLELHIPDFEKAKDYYGKLGFEVVWERKPEGFKGYLVFKMLDNVLCFWGGTSIFTSNRTSEDFQMTQNEVTVSKLLFWLKT